MDLKAVAVMFLVMGLMRMGMTAGEFANARDATTEPAHAHYDYIIVGGGTAGCALAATLSKRYKTLLLERGGTPSNNPSIERMEGWADLLRDTASPSSPVQPFRSADGVHNRRARVLGGGSAINAGFYSRASAEEIRAAGWHAGRVREAYQWVESRVAHPAALGPWQTALRDALLEFRITPNNGRTLEHVSGTKTGHSIFDARGRRHSAAELVSDSNTNLTVLTFATARRVLFTPGAPRRAAGVSFTDHQNETHRASLGESGEVVLAAGALGSPQLLLLSGVGPCADLAAFNVTCVVEAPAVGAHMVDNPINAIVVVSPTAIETSLISVAGITRDGVVIEGASGGNWTWQWPAMGQLNVVPPRERTEETISLTQSILQNSSRATKAEIDQSGFILSKVYDPLSSGTLHLASGDVTENPDVRFNYYHHARDVDACVAGVTYLHGVLAAEAFRGVKFSTVTPVMALLYSELQFSVGKGTEGAYLPDVGNRTETIAWCRDTVTTIWHFHGGCVVGDVVDRKYRVFGVRDLRVVDGSTFAKSPGTNPQATVMMLGRYVGVSMLTDRQRREKRVDSGN